MEEGRLDKLERIFNDASDMASFLFISKTEKRLRERDRRMKLLLRNNPVPTSAEILKADFGTDIINGLDTKFPEHKNQLMSMVDAQYFKNMNVKKQTKELRTVMGRAGHSKDVMLHPEILKESDKRFFGEWKRSYSNTIAHEHIHRLQAYERDTGWISSFENQNTMVVGLPQRKEGIKGTAKHLWQQFNQWSLDNDVSFESGSGVSNISNYFSKEVEMQARLHEVMATGYAAWQKMPASKMELWAAMHNLGLETPSSIKKQLKKSPEGKKALKDFKCTRSVRDEVRQEINELNYVYRFASLKERKEYLWEQSYPAMYGNLLELYGDSLGRERMGLGPKPLAAQNLFSELNNSDELDKVRLDFLTAQVPTEHAVKVLNRLMTMYPEGSQKYEASIQVVNSLLSHEPIRQAVAGQKIRSFGDSDPLMYAVLTNNELAIKALVDAGIDPLRTTKMKNFLGEETEHLTGLMYIPEMVQGLERDLESTPKAAKKLIKDFDEAVFKKNVKEHLDRVKSGLLALSDHIDNLDEVKEIDMGNGITRTISLAQILEETNLTESSKEPTHKEEEKETLSAATAAPPA
jgi:hypothetical protein